MHGVVRRRVDDFGVLGGRCGHFRRLVLSAGIDPVYVNASKLGHGDGDLLRSTVEEEQRVVELFLVLRKLF